MQTSSWIICPKCGKKTHTKLREDTLLTNFPLCCPIVNTLENHHNDFQVYLLLCNRESLISANEFKVQTIKENRSESQTQ